MTANIRWVASITVSVFEDNGDDYTGDDPVKAARLALNEIRALKEPIVAVEQRSTSDDFFSEPEILTQLVVDLETEEVVEA